MLMIVCCGFHAARIPRHYKGKPLVLILRSTAFSFAILWRLILVFPFLILGLIVLSIIIAIPAVILMLIFPLVGILIAASAGYAMSSLVPVMIGARMGLQARGITPRNSYGRMLLPALGYGLIEMLFAIIMVLIGAATFVLLGPASLEEIILIFQTNPDAAIENIAALSPVLAWSILAAIGVALSLVRAALLVPLTGASVGRDPNGSLHTPFWGAGTALFPLFVLVVLSYVINSFVGPLLTFGSFGFALQRGLIDASGASMWSIAVLTLGFVTVWLWSISLQCAGGALAYLRSNSDAEIFAAEDVTSQQIDREELRNLWKSRMPPGRK